MSEYIFPAIIILGAVLIGIYESFTYRRAIAAAKRDQGSAVIVRDLNPKVAMQDSHIAVSVETIRALKESLNRHIKTNGNDPRDVIGVFNTLTNILESHWRCSMNTTPEQQILSLSNALIKAWLYIEDGRVFLAKETIINALDIHRNELSPEQLQCLESRFLAIQEALNAPVQAKPVIHPNPTSPPSVA